MVTASHAPLPRSPPRAAPHLPVDPLVLSQVDPREVALGDVGQVPAGEGQPGASPLPRAPGEEPREGGERLTGAARRPSRGAAGAPPITAGPGIPGGGGDPRVVQHDGPRAAGGADHAAGAGHVPAGLPGDVRHVHAAASKIRHDEAGGARGVGGATGRGGAADARHRVPPPPGRPVVPTHSAACPGVREPMKAQGAPSSASTVHELEAFPPRCHRCVRHLRGAGSACGAPSGTPCGAPRGAVPRVAVLGRVRVHHADHVEAHQPHAQDPLLASRPRRHAAILAAHRSAPLCPAGWGGRGVAPRRLRPGGLTQPRRLAPPPPLARGSHPHGPAGSALLAGWVRGACGAGARWVRDGRAGLGAGSVRSGRGHGSARGRGEAGRVNVSPRGVRGGAVSRGWEETALNAGSEVGKGRAGGGRGAVSAAGSAGGWWRWWPRRGGRQPVYSRPIASRPRPAGATFARAQSALRALPVPRSCADTAGARWPRALSYRFPCRGAVPHPPGGAG